MAIFFQDYNSFVLKCRKYPKGTIYFFQFSIMRITELHLEISQILVEVSFTYKPAWVKNGGIHIIYESMHFRNSEFYYILFLGI